MGILPVAAIVALFFGSWIQASHKSWLKQYMEVHLQSFSRILINVWFQIILSLYNISRTLSSIILLAVNGFLLGFCYLNRSKERRLPLKASLVFQCIIYLSTGAYTSYLTGNVWLLIALLGMLIALLGAFRSVYYYIVWYFTDLSETGTKYELALIYHCLLIVVLLKLYISSDPFTGLIIIQIYITLVLSLIAKIKSVVQQTTIGASDMDIEYILRWYRINQIPSRTDTIESRLSHPQFQTYVKNIPWSMYTVLSVSSIITTLIFCILIIYYWQESSLYLWDFVLFMVNTSLYLYIFYICKKIGIQDKLRRFFWFIAINICYFIAVAQVFKQDTISILFWSILRAVGNNVALNYMQELRSYLERSDYQYRLMSNFFGLIIIVYFFLGLGLDVLLKVAIVVMMVGLWLLLNKDNLKEMMEKQQD